MKYVVSACLAGHACRYNGESSPCQVVLGLVRQGKAMPLCPECMGGLPTPRQATEWQNGRAMGKGGADMTEGFVRGADLALERALASGARAAILKARSPSCGVHGIYDGSFSSKLIPGRGLWAQKLADAGFELYDEDHLPQF